MSVGTGPIVIKKIALLRNLTCALVPKSAQAGDIIVTSAQDQE